MERLSGRVRHLSGTAPAGWLRNGRDGKGLGAWSHSDRESEIWKANAIRLSRPFLKNRTGGKPFCFWIGGLDPHRPYELDSGKAAGIDVDKIQPFACLPNVPVVRSDIADYYFEVQRFDKLVGEAIDIAGRNRRTG